MTLWQAACNDYDKASATAMKLNSYCEYTQSACYYFEDLPEALSRSKTDADGKFSVEADGNVVLVAKARRSVGDGTEFYFWMVKVSESGSSVMLSNDNMTDSKSPDSVVYATCQLPWHPDESEEFRNIDRELSVRKSTFEAIFSKDTVNKFGDTFEIVQSQKAVYK